MASYNQADRPLSVTTPLGPDFVLLVGLSGSEEISRLFHFSLDLVAENAKTVDFDKLLGKKINAQVASPAGGKRSFSGICCRVAQGGRDATFTSYRLEIVPEVWFLTRKHQSRIFQAKTVKEILQEVFKGIPFSNQLKGQYQSRDYCVQYRETDFDFASRLMEEEGIYYFFTHSQSESTLVVADTPETHPDLPINSTVIFEPMDDGLVDEDRVNTWEKVQELRSSRTTLWDHSFEKPHEHLDAQEDIKPTVTAGTVTHKLQVGSSGKLEIYDWPGGYAQRFDGVGPGREARTADIQKIFQDNKRTTKIRMEQEALPSLRIDGTIKIRQMTAGHRMTLQRHFNADGQYVLIQVYHQAKLDANYRSGDSDAFVYMNSFSCIPAALPFRPARVTAKPIVPGTQTAVVVGRSGDEIYTDKYGRVKVQFHWDRDGKHDQNSSCWVRVAQPIAGRRWGSSFFPRVGQEVVVGFEEGDPDRPIVVGAVYNSDQMPPYLGNGPDGEHADDNKVSGFKSNSTQGGSGYNEIRFDDNANSEQLFFHAQRDMDVRVLKDSMETVIGDRHLIVGDKGGNQVEQIAKNKHLHVKGEQVEKIEKAMTLSIGGTLDHTTTGQRTESAKAGYDLSVSQARRVQVGTADSLNVGTNLQEKVGMNWGMEAGQQIYIKAGMTLVIEAGVQLSLKVGGSFIDIGPAGVSISGPMVMINSGGAAGSGSSPSPESPQAAKDAQPNEPTKADDAKTGQKSS